MVTYNTDPGFIQLKSDNRRTIGTRAVNNNGRIQHFHSTVCYRSQRNSMVSSVVHLWRYGNFAIPEPWNIHQSNFSDMPDRLCQLRGNWTAEKSVRAYEKQEFSKDSL